MRFHPRAAGVAALAIGLASRAFAAPALSPPAALTLGPGDLRIEGAAEGGYQLYVRAKAGLGSILLTESTKDPALKTDSYAYRALEENPVNGGELRILSGRTMPSPNELHFLVDSSPEADPAFGSAFHIFIPRVLAWGYPWSRSGRVSIRDGSFVNIRAFAKPYADYSGPFADNPYVVRVSPAAAAPSAPRASVPASAPAAAPYDASLYFPETVSAFRAIADANRGELRLASTDQDIVRQIDALLAARKGKSLDLVLCLDTTSGMAGALDALKARLPAALSRRVPDFPSFRLGLVAFKDYFEEYLDKRFDFTRDLGLFSAQLDALQAGGGRDLSKAVHEGLFAAESGFSWSAQSRLVVLVGNAPPHAQPRGSVDEAAVDEAASRSGIVVDAVAAPR